MSSRGSHSALRVRVVITSTDNVAFQLDKILDRPLRIGRDAECEITLPSPMVSRHHATLQARSGEMILSDCSANGTLVEGLLLKRSDATVTSATHIQIGPFRIHLVTPSEERPASSKPNVSLTESEAPVQMASKAALSGTAQVSADLRREIHRLLVDNLDLVKLERSRMNPHMLRAKVKLGLESIVSGLSSRMPADTNVERLIKELADEALGLGPLEDLLADPDVSEVMVVDPQTIYVEYKGVIQLSAYRFTDDSAVRSCIERIVTPLGKRIDESSPMLDARLQDGSRVNAVIRPLAIRGTCITIRKFAETPLTMNSLIDFKTLSPQMAQFLRRAVVARKNILISGGTGSGKTTLLNVLSASIPEVERVVTIEDSAELKLAQSHVVSLECRQANMEGKGEVTIRHLVKNAMRMRPDRIIVGEVRGGEALDMLQAMNTGHDGSMATTHANNPDEALGRVETLTLMAGLELPSRSIRDQIGHAIDLVVQQKRFSDGSRRITSITEVLGMSADGDLETHEIFGYRRLGTGAKGSITGEFYATGFLPTFIGDFVQLGLIAKGESFL